MSVAVCLLLYSFTVATLSPWMLLGLTRAGTVPRLGVVAWLAAMVSVVASWVSATAFLIVSLTRYWDQPGRLATGAAGRRRGHRNRCAGPRRTSGRAVRRPKPVEHPAVAYRHNASHRRGTADHRHSHCSRRNVVLLGSGLRANGARRTVGLSIATTGGTCWGAFELAARRGRQPNVPCRLSPQPYRPEGHFQRT